MRIFNDSSILICGDPHGFFDHIVTSIMESGCRNVILLGDIEPSAPLDELIPRSLGAEIYWIAGNHDTENTEKWVHVTRSSYKNNNLNGKVVDINGLKVAGLGGVFHRDIWIPPYDPIHDNLDSWVRSNERRNKWFSHQILVHSGGTIFYDQYCEMSCMKADILVTHEAPDCHPYGYSEINDLAVAMGVKKVFHGHHHDNLDYSGESERMRFEAHGVGLCGIKDDLGNNIVAGKLDEKRVTRRVRSFG